MRVSGSTDLENCPISDDLLQQLLKATINSVADVAQSLPEAQRAELAVFCYRRAHFRKLGLSLATQCSKQALVAEAGHAGELIHSQARSNGSRGEFDPLTRSQGGKTAVSLHVV